MAQTAFLAPTIYTPRPISNGVLLTEDDRIRAVGTRDEIEIPTNARVVQLEDEPVYHVRGPVTGNALADLLNDSPVQGRDGEVDYWIGIEDFSVRKIAIRSESPAGPGGATSVTQVAMTISDLGKPVDIMVPDS